MKHFAPLRSAAIRNDVRLWAVGKLPITAASSSSSSICLPMRDHPPSCLTARNDLQLLTVEGGAALSHARQMRKGLSTCLYSRGDSVRLTSLCLLVSALLPSVSRAQAPVFEISPPGDSTVTFFVKASVALKGTFGKWDATVTFASPELTTGVLDIKIQADSVSTGSGMKDGKLKSKDFFDAKQNPLITFHSTKFTQTGPDTIEVDGDFTIRGATKPEKLTFTVTGAGTGSGSIKGTMAFDRKDYGMNKSIPFVTIADRVEVTVDLKGKRVSGPPVDLKQSSAGRKSHDRHALNSY
jgi:polyisoprenoid-binding protein YceI